ncbi:MAG: hypothetical protein WBG86_04865, partial [Polyangiales bacterium]
MQIRSWFLTLSSLMLSWTALSGCSDDGSESTPDFSSFTWTEINGDAPWSARAGLHVVPLGGRFFLMGGRTPLDSPIPGASDIWSDVWVSDDRG